MRALIKLCRPALDPEIYQQENIHYRDISRLLAYPRICAARIKAAAIIKDLVVAGGCDKFYDELINSIIDEHKCKTAPEILENVQKQVLKLLDDNIQRFEIYEIPAFNSEKLMKGLLRSYRAGNRSLNTAYENPTSISIHDFRKKLKYLWNQMILLKNIWPGTIGQMVRQMDLLGDKLGLDHDLADLEQYLSGFNPGKGQCHDIALSAVETKRQHIQRMIWPLAFKVFAEKPVNFISRVNRYWQISYAGKGFNYLS